MDRRGWPWKRRSSEKANSVNNDDQVATHVQVSQEKYAYLSGLEDEVKVLNEKLSAALLEVKSKEDLVKQHTKIAEDAVSGWEKAEAETSSLKSQLEALTLLKLSAEERAGQLDFALKECVKEVRNVKEEGEQKLHDVVFVKTRQWEKIKSEFEAKISAFEQELLQASAENNALTRTLDERSNMLMKINDEKSQADAQIEVLKANIQSCEREISSLKYEVHIVTKELEIRTEEKNMNLRSADVASRQHLEDVKKITKLESECQRLRGLVKKKLPGPATIAQMRHEVEGYGKEYSDHRVRRSPSKCSSPRAGMVSDFTFDNMQQSRRENEFLAARLMAMEEENLMLKEALTKRNSELQASRSVFAKTASRLRNIEAQAQGLDHQESPLKYASGPTGTFFNLNRNSAPSITSMSEDGIDEEGFVSASSSVALTADMSNHRVERFSNDSSINQMPNQMDLMDDFLEMERLACMPAESNGTSSFSDGIIDKVNGDGARDSFLKDASLKENDSGQITDISYSSRKKQTNETGCEQNRISVSNLQARISLVFQSHDKTGNLVQLYEDIGSILRDLQEELPKISESCIVEEVKQPCNQENTNSVTFANSHTQEDVRKAITKIHDFVMRVHKESGKLQGKLCGTHVQDKNIEAFSEAVGKFLSDELNEREIILILSLVLAETDGLDLEMSSKGSDEGSISPDCIDKATLSENSVMQQEHEKDGFADSSSNPEIPQEVLSGAGFKVFSMEDFENLQKEKETLATDLARCIESLDQTKCLLLETEQEVTNLKSNLSNSENSNSLAETQLKCMAESYKLLEARFKDMETEINQLRTQAELLGNELLLERQAHQVDVEKFNELQEQMERTQKALLQSEADNSRTTQEKEIAAATEKLAQCQETIMLLGRQLKSFQPQLDLGNPTPSGRYSISTNLLEDIKNSATKSHGGRQAGHSEVGNLASMLQREGGESPHHFESLPSDHDIPSSPVSSKRSKHGSMLSTSNPSTTTPVKHSRGFSRFFSKGKNDH